MDCSSCGTANRESAKFCRSCGVALAMKCGSCGAPYGVDQTFCDECGLGLVAPPPSSGPAATTDAAQGVNADARSDALELRFVSVLFVDLVGFTSLSESRDAEDVRELLGRYFQSARTVVESHGGLIEKFIGDAVMAVWGASVAREDDAERAVLAALEVVEAVAAFGEEVGEPSLRARAGVVTGQVAAVNSRHEEGIVVGDRVNTASRVQSAAAPGTVLVDEATRQVARAAVSFEDAGEHSVKGKTEPLHLWRALGEVAGVGSRDHELAAEWPLIGRDTELRLIKDLFHATVERTAVRLVLITGEAGIGKTRLRREFYGYVDGLADRYLWHLGRCLSHGEGVAYWALAQMVRQRLGIAEDAATAVAAQKLDDGLAELISDPRELEFIAPRLGALLGVAQPGLDRPELFAGWRLFFERLAAQRPVLMVFEGLEWADQGLLDFIDGLLDWSLRSPILILAFARPELAARREGWPAGRRAATTVPLDPLDDGAVRALIDTAVDGLPDQAVERIVAQAQGIPLYAVEMLRALIDRGALRPVGGRLVAAGDLGDLEVPATLTALLSSRLDALASDERATVKAMSVFGGSFPREAAAVLTALGGEERLDAALRGLTRKQVFVIAADPLSPERGHYAFTQGLFRTVAYGLLTRRDRQRLHLAAADHLGEVFAGEGAEVVEVIAAHLLAALGATRPEEAGREALRMRAVAALRRAALRAATVGAPEAAQGAYTQAADLSGEQERAELVQAAGEMALQAGRGEQALILLDRAADAHRNAGRLREAAMTAGPAGWALSRLGRNRDAADRITQALDALEDPDEISPDTARLNAVLAAALARSGDYERAVAVTERALTAAEALELPDVLVGALNAKAMAYTFTGRPREAGSLFALAVEIAQRHAVDSLSLTRAQANLANMAMYWDHGDAATRSEAALASCRRRGDPHNESIIAGILGHVHLLAGRWDQLDQLTGDLLAQPDRVQAERLYHVRLLLHVARGDGAAATDALGHLTAWQAADDVEVTAGYDACVIVTRVAQGDFAAALDTALRALPAAIEVLTPAHESVRDSWPEAVGAALHLARHEDAQTLVALLADRPPGHLPPYLRAHLIRARARLAAAQGNHDGVEDRLHDAIDRFEQLAYPLWLAVTRTDLAAWLVDQGRGDEAAPLLEEAGRALTALGAGPALTRANALSKEQAQSPPGPGVFL